MRLLALALALCTLTSSLARAQPMDSADAGAPSVDAAPPRESTADTAAAPNGPSAAAEPVALPASDLAQPPAPIVLTLPPALPVPTAPTLGAPLELAPELKLADDWVAFEAVRDRRTRSAERVSFPVLLGIEAGLGVAGAVLLEDARTESRVLAGVAGALALGALVPTVLAKSRHARRAWMGAGSTAWAVAAGASIATAEDERAGRWIGAAVAVQGLAMLPVGLMPGFPEEAEYDAYSGLTATERRAAAARLLARIDRFEQRAATIALISSLAAAAVLGAGAGLSDAREDATLLGGLSLVPLGTALLMFAPRLLVRGRLDRFTFGERPRQLPLNGW